jgi:large subunit ribosomal protein L13
MNHTIDATEKTLGRLASEVAALLIGKNKLDYSRNVLSGNTVTVMNAGKLKVSPKKLQEKVYSRYSGYPGGLKQLSMAHVVEKKGYKEALSIAVKGMLPDNKLKKGMMKALTINE